MCMCVCVKIANGGNYNAYSNNFVFKIMKWFLQKFRNVFFSCINDLL